MKWSNLLLVLLLICSGCNTIKSSLSKLSFSENGKEKEIAALKIDYEQKVAAKDKETIEAIAQLNETKNNQIKGAANSFYALDWVFKTLPSPLRTDIVVHNLAQEGWAATGFLMPTYETMVKINERLKNDLDETKTSLTDLQKSHDKAVLESQKLNDAAKLAADRIAQLEKDKTAAETTFNQQLAAKSGELAKLAQNHAALEQERSDDKEATRLSKLKAIAVVGGLALACLAGAIWSPAFKDKFAIMAAALGLVAAGIWYVQPWHIGVFAGLVILGIAIWAVRQYQGTDKALTAVTNFLHEKGELASEEFKAWQTKYVKNKDGTIATVPDKQVAAVIDSKLMASDRK